MHDNSKGENQLMRDDSPCAMTESEEEFYTNLEENTTLADYFFIVGLNEQHLSELLDKKLTRE